MAIYKAVMLVEMACLPFLVYILILPFQHFLSFCHFLFPHLCSLVILYIFECKGSEQDIYQMCSKLYAGIYNKCIYWQIQMYGKRLANMLTCVATIFVIKLNKTLCTLNNYIIYTAF